MADVAFDSPEFIESIKQSVSDQLKPVADQVAALSKSVAGYEQRLVEIQKPQSKASKLFGGGAPAVRQGEDPLTSRGYRFSSLMRACATGDWSGSKVEQEVSSKLREAYGALGGEGNSVYAPLGGAHLQRMDEGLASEIGELVRQGVRGADVGQMGRVSQSAGIYDDTNLGILLGETQRGEMIDLLRAREIFSQSGAVDFTLPPNGRIQFPRWTKDFDAYWVGEKMLIGETEGGMGMINMIAKKLGAITTWSNELLRFSSPSTEAMIRGQLARALAWKLDSSLLAGVGSEFSPVGLLNTAGLVTRAAGVTGTDGDTLQPRDLALLLAKIAEGNVDVSRAAAFMRPLLLADISTRRADAVTASDGKGPLVFPYTEKDGVAKLSRAKVFETTAIPKNRSKGSSGNTLTLLLAGVFEEFLIGRVGVLEFAINTQSTTNFANDMTSLRVIQHVDGKARRPEAFGYIDKLVMPS